jgi:hypothetical protein
MIGRYFVCYSAEGFNSSAPPAPTPGRPATKSMIAEGVLVKKPSTSSIGHIHLYRQVFGKKPKSNLIKLVKIDQYGL